ncbi:MAG TPA: molybdopterin-binding protein [Candidatus Limnocylindrales bacterium]|nr:molybdopterin-binding protein [Candidatus Limnocylindrales bacterium]
MRTLTTAEILSIGSELTVGETRDTNAGDLARALTERGVVVVRITALPDDQGAVRDAFLAALARADLVIATGGLGPTPDDLTRESLAAAVGETPTVDPDVSVWLEGLFARRQLAFPEANRKQAWRIPSATIVPNEHGTAPGWWVDRSDGRVVVALPGPPREMRPMWESWVVPRLIERGLGRPTTAITLRTTGLGESVIADRLGSILDRDANPIVATYARSDGVDIRISAVAEAGRTAEELVRETESLVLELIGDAVWARGSATWPEAILAELERRDQRLAIVEIGLRGALLGLLGEGLGNRLAFAESLQARPALHDGLESVLEDLARRVRELGGCEIGLAVEVTPTGGDLAATVAISAPEGDHGEHRLVFLDGPLGRSRGAIAAAATLLTCLRAGSAG